MVFNRFFIAYFINSAKIVAERKPMLLPNIILLVLLSSGVYAGLDKLLVISIYIAIIICSDLLNKVSDSVTTESKIIDKIFKIFKEKYQRSLITKKVRTLIYFANFIVWTLLIVTVLALALGYGLTVEESFNSRLFYAGVYLILYFYAVFGIRTLQKDDNSTTLIPEARWYRMLQYLSVYHFVFACFYICMSFLTEEECIEYRLFEIHDYSIFAVLAYLFCLLCERILDNFRIISSYTKNIEHKYEVPFFVSIIASNSSLKQSIIKTLELISGVDLSKSEMADYIISHLEPVTIIALIIFWLLSSMVIIPPDQEAIFYRLGKINGNQSYKPGIHIKLPWPLESMKLYKPSEIKVLNIGFTPEAKKTDLIWSKVHSKENFSLLVGNGVELVAVDMQLFYKVHDLYKFVSKVQNPENYIEALTYKLLTENTVSQTFDSIMSQNRDSLISNLRQKLQTELDAIDIGVTAVEIVILAIHPPLEVTQEYEDVISSKIDKQKDIIIAKTNSVNYLHLREAFAKDTIMKAEGNAATTVANAFGEAKSFESRIIGFQTNPELEKFRLKLDSIINMTNKKYLYVIDKSFMRKNDRIMLNLQN